MKPLTHDTLAAAGLTALVADDPQVRYADIERACQEACAAIAPAWPLDRAIAVNPHWSRIGMPVR